MGLVIAFERAIQSINIQMYIYISVACAVTLITLDCYLMMVYVSILLEVGNLLLSDLSDKSNRVY